MENPTHSFRETNLVLSAYVRITIKNKIYNCDELNLAKEKKGAFFVPFILSKGNFFKICVLSQCIGY